MDLPDAVKFDKKDYQILDELILDARRSTKKIAKKLGFSEQIINYRINRMIRNKVISKIIPILRIDKLGYGAYWCFFRIDDLGKETEIIQRLWNNSNVYHLVRIKGKWDLLVVFVAKDVNSFFEVLNKENFGDYSICTIVQSIQFKKKNNHVEEICIHGGQGCTQMLDERDRKILKELIENGRAANFEIGKKTGMSPNTVQRRIGSMEKRGIIQGYSAFVHHSVFGGLRRRISMRVKNDAGMVVMNFARADPSISFLAKTIGYWNYALCISCNDEPEYNDFMRRFKNSLGNVLIEYEEIEYVYNYGIKLEALLQ